MTMNNNPLNLGQLTVEEIDFEGLLSGIITKREQVEKECRKKYGNDWFDHYVKITNSDSGIDFDEKTVNYAIFHGSTPPVSNNPIITMQTEQNYIKKMKRLFGPFYKRYIHHEPNDPKINKMLLKDALSSGKWRELPKELHAAYHIMAGE